MKKEIEVLKELKKDLQKAGRVLSELIDSAKPFLSDKVVDETSGTIPLMERLEKAIEKAEEIL